MSLQLLVGDKANLQGYQSGFLAQQLDENIEGQLGSSFSMPFYSIVPSLQVIVGPESPLVDTPTCRQNGHTGDAVVL